jgi:DnaK suppressor protein
MTPELEETLRKALESDRQAAISDLREYGADPDNERVHRIEGVDDNFADLAAATAERSEAYALIERTRQRLSAVEAALAKMDAGTYGICEDCGRPIAEARLEARPLSVRCVECAGKR